MTKLPERFDWRQSLPHLRFLRHFIHFRSISNEDWQWVGRSLPEDPADAIARFVKDGALVPAQLDEVLAEVYRAAQIKRFLSDRKLKVTGSKAELIERLAIADPLGAATLVAHMKMMKCSPSASALLQAHDNAEEQGRRSAEHQSHVALLEGDVKEAYRIHLTWERKYDDPQCEADIHIVRALSAVVRSHPAILRHLSPQHMRELRAAVCMKRLWGWGEPTTFWLSTAFDAGHLDPQVAANYLATHADIRSSVESAVYDVSGFKLVFDPDDVDSCHLCLSLRGETFVRSTFPDLPLPGCTSLTGCMCSVEQLRPPPPEDRPVYHPPAPRAAKTNLSFIRRATTLTNSQTSRTCLKWAS